MEPMDGPDWLQVRQRFVQFYVLRDTKGLYLIDTGFVGGRAALRRALQRRGWDQLPLRGLLLTHGHLDHAYNAAAIAAESGAWVAAPRLDADLIAGHPREHGWGRVCAALHAVGRPLFRYEVPRVDRWLDDGTKLPIWGGLTAITLPGHTPGHLGFYSKLRRLLFSGDLFVSARRGPFLPPFIFNSQPKLMPDSVRRAAALDLAGVLPNHGSREAPEVHLQRLHSLAARLG